MNSSIARRPFGRLAMFLILSLAGGAVIAQTAAAQLADDRANYSAADSEGRYVHLVTFKEPGLIERFRETRGPNERFSTQSAEMRAAQSQIQMEQAAHVQRIASTLGRTVEISHYFPATHSGLATRLTPDEAEALRNLPGVVSVERERVYQLDTYRGPTFIGADAIWGGVSTPDGSAHLGLNMVAAVLDSGLDSLSPSFANDPTCGHGDGGVPDKVLSVLDCGTTDGGGLCNGPDSGSDSNTHGSHVAGTVAGNTIDVSVDPPPTLPGSFTEMSGVAPCAHIRAYRVCPTTCPGARIQAGMNSVLLHGDVDVMNFSISGGTSPWSDNDRRKLDLVDAGIFVAASAGNTSDTIPNPVGQVNHRGPWVMSVAASTRDTNAAGGAAQGDVLAGFSFRGPTPAPLADLQKPDITAPGVSIYASSVGFDFTIVGPGSPPANLERIPMSLGSGSPLGVPLANHPITFDPGQPAGAEGCNPGFPANFFNGAAALIQRGSCAFTEKITNAFNAGASFVIIWNNAEGGLSMNTDGQPAVPAFSISLANGQNVRDFIQANPTATFDYSGQLVSQFNFLSGTSMSSPHLTGAALLVRQANPSWTPSEVKSAIQMTASITGFKENGTTPWDWDDVGSGRVNLNVAALAGLVMDETFANYLAANPATGGDVKTLNTPSVRNLNCSPSCTFTRTVRSTRSESTEWAVNASVPGFSVAVTPNNFTLADSSSTRVLNIMITPLAGEPGTARRFGIIRLIPQIPDPDLIFGDGFEGDGGDKRVRAKGFDIPESHITVAVQGAGSSPTSH